MALNLIYPGKVRYLGPERKELALYKNQLFVKFEALPPMVRDEMAKNPAFANLFVDEKSWIRNEIAAHPRKIRQPVKTVSIETVARMFKGTPIRR
jgi:hypothetical protein